MAVVNLGTIDVISIFHELRATTGLFRVWKESGDDIATQCPFHGGGNERNPSFGICVARHNPHYGKYHCFACGVSGTIIDLVNRLHNKPVDSDYGITVAQSFGDVELLDSRNQIHLLPRQKKVVEDTVSPYELITYRQEHSDYLTNRGIRQDIQDAFDCGFDSLNRAVTFPVHNVNGSTAFIVRRAVDLKWYNYPAGVKKIMYGLYELTQICPGAKQVVLVESVINALTLWGMQIPALAFLGTGSKEQIDYLNTLPVRHWILGMDGDSAGQTATIKLSRRLRAHTTVMPIPPGYDINDLDVDTNAILYTLRTG